MLRTIQLHRFAILTFAATIALAGCAQDPPGPAPVPEPGPSIVANEAQQSKTEESAGPAADSSPAQDAPKAASTEDQATEPAPTGVAKAAHKGQSVDEPDDEPVNIKPLTEEQLEKLLAARLDGGLHDKFGQFGNMFLVMSRIKFGVGIGLMSSDREISNTELQPVFPIFYKPTLREFLDAIALQTFSKWKYDPTNKFVKSSVKDAKPVDDLAIFEFTKVGREKPYTVKLMDGWKSDDKGHWLMLIPPSFPVGMDIYQMGTYSADNPADEAELFRKVRSEVAQQWARNVGQNVSADDMKSVKVGEFDALYFDAMVPSQLGGELHWRQWVFMAGNRCYFIVSTIKPDLEDEIFPDVEVMLETFRGVEATE